MTRRATVTRRPSRPLPSLTGWGVAGLCLALAVPVLAQDVRLDGEVDRYSLSTDDTLYLTVSLNVTGSLQTAEPELERSADFNLLGAPERQDGYQLNGTQIARYSQRVFALRPCKAGNLVVPRAKVAVDGHTYRTRPLRVQVTAGTAPPSNAPATMPAIPSPAGARAPFSGTPDFVIRCRTDRASVTVNQQLTVTLEYYTGYRLERTPGQAGPRAEGFVAEDLPDPAAEEVTINDRQYARYVNVWALFPTAAGSYKISAPPEHLMLPPDYRQRDFVSNTVRVNVKPLPSSGGHAPAVGRFTVALTTDKTQLKVGESLLARVVVDGVGNLQALPTPSLRPGLDCRVWESARRRQPEARTQDGKPLLGGRVEFEFVVLPRVAGALSLGPVELATYDPDHGTTGTVRSRPVGVKVLPGATPPAGPTPAATGAGAKGDKALAVPLWALSVAGGVLAGGLALVAVRRRLHLRRASAEARLSGAARAARTRLRQARHAPAGEVEGLVAEALSQYVADRCALPGPTALPAEVCDALEARGVSEELAQRLSGMISECRQARFAPRGASVGSSPELVRLADDLVTSTEQALRASSGGGSVKTPPGG
jgi:hypothetical protein